MTQIIGDKALHRKLRKLTDLSFLRKHVKFGAEHIAGKLESGIPDAPAKNKTPGHSWYDRGQGSKYMYKDGSIKDYANSEDLIQGWISKAVSDTRAIVGNDASYGQWVQDPDKQSRVMKAIGWKTTDTVTKEEEKVVLKMIQKAVDRELAKG